MPNPVLYYALADEVLTVAREALATVLPADLLHHRTGVVNGPPSIDEWESCAEHLVAWVESVGPTLNMPEPFGQRVTSQEPDTSIQVVVQTIRCEPTFDDAGNFPSSASLDAAARLLYIDARVILGALSCWAVNADYRATDDHDVTILGQQAVPPLGGVAGYETRILVAGEDLCGCEGDTAPTWANLPEGFLDGLTA